MSPSTGVRTLRNVALLPWRTTQGALKLGARGLLAVPRQLQRVGSKPGEGLLDATANRASKANHQLHQPAEGVFAIPHYDQLTANDAAIAVQTLTSSSEVHAAMRHERATKNRKTVADAGERRLTELTAVGH